MVRRSSILLCLAFSGLSALVYQVIWTRLLGFAFGTTTEAIATVLAVFFAGLALGNFAAARLHARVARPLRIYAFLELGIGAWALLSLPALRSIDLVFYALGVPETAAGLSLVRVLSAALILLPPSIAMGATLPVVARGLVSDDRQIGRASAQLYAANTLGAVLGAYLCGFWLIPGLGLTSSLLGASAVNLAVGAFVWWTAGQLRVPVPPAEQTGAAPQPGRRAFLACFCVSGFVALGYEIVWSKVFGIVMEGTLYGFAAVLSAYLLGIGLGSAAMAPRVDRIRDLPRAFALLHVAIGAAVFLGTALVPYLPFFYDRLAASFAGDAVHLLYLLVLPIVLVPTALFGAAFPILIRMHAPGAASAGHSVGIATAVNTLGSIAASAIVGFWWIPTLGTDGSLYCLLLIDFATAMALLVAFKRDRGRARPASWTSWTPLAGSAAVVGTVALAFGGVHVEEAVTGRQIRAADLGDYARRLEQAASRRAVTIEGKSAIVSVYATPTERLLRTNGLPEASVRYEQPYASVETLLLGFWPYALAERAERALVIGLGGGNTLSALTHTRLRSIDVVEFEEGVMRAVELLREGLPKPLDDPRVSLRIADGRNDLLLRKAAGAPGYDLITSQPSHPWRVGASNLFTEEFFRLARASLRDGGVFASWLNGIRMDPDSLLAVVTSFERVFPGALLMDVSRTGRQAFMLAGSTGPLTLDLPRIRDRLAEPQVARHLALYDLGGLLGMLARVEGPTHAFAAIDPEASNTDDNAFVETRTPRALRWQHLDFAALEARLAAGAPLLPESRGELDVPRLARALLERPASGPWPYRAALERLLAQFEQELPSPVARRLRAEANLLDPSLADAAIATLRELAQADPSGPEALRAIGSHLARRRSDLRAAGEAFASAYARSGAADDAYDAGRALHPVDPALAEAWFDRIPESQRATYPRLAYYSAQRALTAGVGGQALRETYEALAGFLLTAEGRSYPGGHELASRLAWQLGDRSAARGHADSDADQRIQRAQPHLKRARTALEAGELDAARTALAAAIRLVPGSRPVSMLAAEVAQASGDPEELQRAFTRLRRWAPTVRQANVTENYFRTQHGLPLRPERANATSGG